MAGDCGAVGSPTSSILLAASQRLSAQKFPALRRVGRNDTSWVVAIRRSAPSGLATGKAPNGRLRRMPSATTTTLSPRAQPARVVPENDAAGANLALSIDRRSGVLHI